MIRTIIDLVNSFQNEPGLALVHNGTPISYRQLYRDIAGLAAYLGTNYECRDQPVIISATNKYKFIIGIYSAIYAGATAVPVADKITAENLDSIIRKTGSDIIICAGSIAPGKECLNTVEIAKYAEDEQAIDIETTEQNPALVLFTSGTTGEPKGTILSHYNLIQSSNYINEFMEVSGPITEYLMIPVYHSFGFGRTRCVFSVKGTLVLDDGLFNPLLMLKRLARFNCDSFSGVPSVMAMLIQAGKNRFDKFGEKIKYVELGSAPMLTRHKKFLIEHLPNANICMHYGLTEASRSCFINFRKESDKLNTVGRPSPGVRIKIVDQRGSELPNGQIGEISVKGPNVAKGYLNESSHNNARFADDWFFTGDSGLKDDQGYIYFRGRLDDIINVGGEKVSPLEIENLIRNSRTTIGDFCVVGIDDDEGIYGTLPVICTTDVNFSDAELKKLNAELASAGLKHIFLPRKIFHIPEIARTHNGKIFRKRVAKDIIDLVPE